MRASASFWADTMQLWQRFLDPEHAEPFEETPEQARDKRFKAPQWREEPVFDFLRQSYFVIADHMLKGVDSLEGVDPKQKEQIRFATKGFIDAVSPTNFPATNPQVLEKIVETKGESLLKGLQHMLSDMAKGQMTQTAEGAFELGRNLAMTPGKVVKRTPLYELIQYAPVTEQVYKTPLIIFPPWINRFYILDLTPEKSFIRWAVAQGLTVFVVSWKSADATMKDVVWDDYVERPDRRDRYGARPAGRRCGPCDRLLRGGDDAGGDAGGAGGARAGDKVKSATFFTAQVDFSEAGDLSMFVDDDQLAMIKSLGAEGFPRRALHGDDVQPAARPRPDLELCHQQLSDGAGLCAVRSAPLEFGRHQPAVRLAPELSHRPVSRQQIGGAGRAVDRGHADRPDQGDDADLYPGGPRGSYRAGAERLEDHPSFQGAAQVRAGGIGPYRRRGEPALGGQISILDQRKTCRDALRVFCGSKRDQGELVARLGRHGSKPGRRERWLQKLHARPARAS
jgi:hypothetical protein